jgi:DNA-binding CsgD family transcriptional regulator
MHQSRVHAQAAARAADRIGQEINPGARDELFAAVLLHDIGKLVLFHASRGYNRMSDPGSAPPEERIRRERRELGTDHASLGGLLLHRWGLAQLLVDAVAAHHRSDADSELATLVRLADMIAHQAQGNPVDRRVMLRLANGCGFDVKALRDTLFDLPHAGGSQRRRATPSPLSDRETEVLRLLAQGKVYKQIGQELGLSPSTVRSHLHHSYEKLQVADRAQAVLKVTEMAWI